jgi:DNA-binding response OmpR family regulator
LRKLRKVFAQKYWKGHDGIPMTKNHRTERNQEDRGEVKLLIIEDCLPIFTIVNITLATRLRQDGYEHTIRHAQNGADGLAQVVLFHPTLILLDIEMPILDGYQFLHILRAQENTIPVIVMTGSAGANEQRMGREAGCSAFIQKPFKLSLLYHHVREQLRMQEAQQREKAG